MSDRFTLDLNCDLGEGAGHDAELMALITSANIACGAHAGDEGTMQATVALAERHGVAIGAHPGFPDRQNFGRVEMDIGSDALRRLVVEQIALLCRMTSVVRHVKPHGALYNMAARDRRIADEVCAAVRAIDPKLVVYALAGSELVGAARRAGLAVAEEVFADRTYRRDGSLTPRSHPGALIIAASAVISQALGMVRNSTVTSTDGRAVSIRADTLCLHGDGAHAVEFARGLRTELTRAGIGLKAFSA